MNLPDVIAFAATAPWLAALTLAAALVALAASIFVGRRLTRERRRLDGVRRDLEAYVEASTRVADAVDHLLRGELEPAEAAVSSRRYLLMQARRQALEGAPIESVAARFELCDDEKRLLAFLTDAGRHPRHVYVA